MDPYLEYSAETASTNDDLKRRVREGCVHGTTLYAGRQTGGRGRAGRTWHGPAGENLYFSIALIDNIDQIDLRALPFVGAVCLAQWLDKHTELTFGLKWPNDVLVNDLKLAGILCEGVSRPQGAIAAVMGIGMNVNARMEDLPAETRKIATSLQKETERIFAIEPLVRDLRHRILRWYETLQQTGTTPLFERWRAYECTMGRRVRIVDEAKVGTARRLDKDGALIVQLDNGRIQPVRVGDVTFLSAGHHAEP